MSSINPLRRELEDEVRATLRTVSTANGNAGDNMTKMAQILNNGITHAHDDVGRALDAMREEAHALVARVDKLVDEHKATLHAKGQKIATILESTMQELKRSVAWLEEQTPRLHEPKLETPALPKPDADREAGLPAA